MACGIGHFILMKTTREQWAGFILLLLSLYFYILNLNFLMHFCFVFCSRPNLLHDLWWALWRHLRSNLPCDCSEESSKKMFQRHGNSLRTQRGNYLRAHWRGKIPKTILSIMYIIFRKLKVKEASWELEADGRDG